jgi:hypothetical protein
MPAGSGLNDSDANSRGASEDGLLLRRAVSVYAAIPKSAWNELPPAFRIALRKPAGLSLPYRVHGVVHSLAEPVLLISFDRELKSRETLRV